MGTRDDTERSATLRGARPFAAALVGILVVGASAVSAQTIDGILLDRDTSRPIDVGLVTLLTPEGDTVAAVLTDASGRFRVHTEEVGDFLLAATALGYRATVASSVFTLGKGSSMSLEFRVESVPIEIGGLRVEASSSWISQPALVQNGFVERVRHGFGRFITPVQIAETSSLATTDLLTRTGRVMTSYAPGGDRVLMRGFVGGYCNPFIYLDGIRVANDLPLDALVPLHVLDAVEVYRSAEEAPPQYTVGLTRCGVIVLWTRSSR